MTRPISSLAPDIERRLAGWVKIQERNVPPREVKLRPTITISRQFGCEGFPLADRLKGLLEEASGESWNIVDKLLIEQVSQDEEIPLSLLKRLGDLSHAIEAFGLHSPEHVTHDMAFDKVARALVQFAKLGDAIVVGRGGAILCKGFRNCFHFRLVASLPWRIATFARRMDLSTIEAEAQVKTNEKLRERFINQCLGEDVTNPRFYDAVFNNERHSTEEIARAILAYVRSGWEDRSFFKHG